MRQGGLCNHDCLRNLVNFIFFSCSTHVYVEVLLQLVEEVIKLISLYGLEGKLISPVFEEYPFLNWAI